MGTFGFSQLHFPDANTGWAVSLQDPWGEVIEAILIYTRDGGTTWNERVIKDEELIGIDYKPRAVHFLNAQEGWVGGVNNIIHTIDGGESWRTIKVDYEGKPKAHTHGAWREIDLVVNRIYFSNSSEGWVVGYGRILNDYYGQFILYTNDGGESWEAQIPVSDGFKFGGFTTLDFIHPGEGWIGGWGPKGILLHTKNGGLNWDALPGLPDIIQDVSFTDSQNGWAVITTGWTPFYIYHTADGGHNWLGQRLSDSAIDRLQGGLLYALDFANKQEGWAVGSHGVIVHTNDGGKHWALEESPVNVKHLKLVDVQYVPGNGVFASCNDGTVLRLKLEEPVSLIARGKMPTTWAELKKGKTNSDSTAIRKNRRMLSSSSPR